MLWTDGPPGGTYYVVASTNVALPMTDWIRIETNVFDGSGNFSFTNSIDPAKPARFFRVQLP